MVTLEELKRIMPHAGKRAEVFEPHLNAAMQEFEVDNGLRIAAFLAQVAHESGELRYVRELASGAAYDTGAKARALGNTPEDDDDGERYKGRGLIQITGRDNYRACSEALFGSGDFLLHHPEHLERPGPACLSAAWFWKTRGLNELADKGDFKLITKRINGGYNGWKDRLAYYERAKEILG